MDGQLGGRYLRRKSTVAGGMLMNKQRRQTLGHFARSGVAQAACRQDALRTSATRDCGALLHSMHTGKVCHHLPSKRSMTRSSVMGADAYLLVAVRANRCRCQRRQAAAC